MTLSDWSECPECESTALYSRFVAYVGSNGCCAMCERELKPDQITLIKDPISRKNGDGNSKEARMGGMEENQKASIDADMR